MDVVIEIYNPLAKRVYDMKINSFTGTTSIKLNDELSEGLYLVRIKSNEKIKATKLMLNEDH